MNFNNFNFSHKNEYLLNHSMIRECIHLYGILCKLVVTEKVNFDTSVFGDYSAIKTNSNDTFSIYMLPENTEDVDRLQYEYNEFGFNNYDTTTGFISTSDLPEGLNISNLVGCLMVLPSNQILEISDCECRVPGINNLWTYSDQVSVYKLALKPYERRVSDEIDNQSIINTMELKGDDINVDEINAASEVFDSLDGYFETLLNTKETQDYQAEVEPLAESKEADKSSVTVTEKREKELNREPDTMVQKVKNKDRRVIKPIVDNSEKDPFGW